MALSAAAGPKLQQECKLIGKVDTGKIVVTSGANLACKHVFHTSSAEWENGAGEKVSTNIIFFSGNERFDKSAYYYPLIFYPPTLIEEAPDHLNRFLYGVRSISINSI